MRSIVVSAMLLASCVGQEPAVDAKWLASSTAAVTAGRCEDQCGECGDLHRCADSVRYYCAADTTCSTGSLSLRCMCCGRNEILVGNSQTGYCTACPAGMEAQFDNNYCCQPMSAAQACAGQCGTTVDDGCGWPVTCPSCGCQTCASRGFTCGTFVNNCGQTLSCGGCGPGGTCIGNTECSCRAPYQLCGNGRCARTCP